MYVQVVKHQINLCHIFRFCQKVIKKNVMSLLELGNGLSTSITIVSIIIPILLYKWFHRPKGFPPGPYGVPLLGNLPFTGKEPFKVFAEWSKRYGNVFAVRMGSEDWVILNDYDTIHQVC